MSFLKTIVAGSALAIALLATGPTPTNALVTGGSGIHVAPRNLAGVSPAHQGIAKRKRNAHKQRKRCLAQNAPPPANNNNNNNNNGNNSNSNNGNTNNNHTPPPPTSYNGSGKVGLGWAPDVPQDFIINAVTSSTGYVYNWSAWPPSVNIGSAKFCPMFWGPKDNIPDDFQRLIRYGDVNYGVAIAMNEVNQDGQARMDTGYGIQLWRQYMLPLRWEKSYRIGSPSTTNDPSGIQWMQGFLGGLGDNEKPDFLCLHWYGIGAGAMIDYLNQYHSAFPGYKLWVTEFACNDFSHQSDCGDFNGFMDQVTGYMDSQDWIEAYFAFGFVQETYGVDERNRLINPWTGQITDLGYHYIN